MKFICLVLFLLFSYNSVCQADLLTIEGSTYHYKGKEYKCKDLGSIYRESEKAMMMYKSGQDSYKQARLTVAAGSITLGVGVVYGASRQWKGAAVFLVGAIVLGVASVIRKIVADQKMSSAIKVFNFDMMKRDGYKSSSTLSLRGNENGMGLVLNF